MVGSRDAGGSKWHRWDPHLHAPGTVLNDQYPGADGWARFLDRIEASDPSIRALGITDYYSVDVYETVLAKKKEGRLADVDLIFPNVEMRYGIGTGKGSPINVHPLVSPTIPNISSRFGGSYEPSRSTPMASLFAAIAASDPAWPRPRHHPARRWSGARGRHEPVQGQPRPIACRMEA
jgi:hypothetical protein